MDLDAGNTYFVDDIFFNKINDPYLKTNHKTTSRPHYFAFKDPYTSLYWLVPCSSQIAKFEKIISQKKQQHKPTDAIKIIKIQGKITALLFQDMFPISSDYITSQYIRNGQPYSITNPKTISYLEKNAQKIISLIRHGVRFTPTQPDTKRIETILLTDLHKK
ncbi:hypothetical protein LJC58_08520 [Lachnospiraceae bacterium OttesenSCG-928-D06]|nr:hypothetical protein [Lachnospiraceae bacterium OttesenSCG-928-D06]